MLASPAYIMGDNMPMFFHEMEKLLPVFPHNGKNFSTVWKTRF